MHGGLLSCWLGGEAGGSWAGSRTPGKHDVVLSTTPKKSPQVGLLLFLTPFAFPLTITLTVPLVVVIVILALAPVLFLGVLHHVLMVELVGMPRVETNADVGSKAGRRSRLVGRDAPKCPAVPAHVEIHSTGLLVINVLVRVVPVLVLCPVTMCWSMRRWSSGLLIHRSGWRRWWCGWLVSPLKRNAAAALSESNRAHCQHHETHRYSNNQSVCSLHHVACSSLFANCSLDLNLKYNKIATKHV